ncbi:replicative DNA helicase [Neomoorella thermoacetica]|uniref:Replicative DNA helicase n=3 Tax=Neomoorella thermoacetica TaxID=1525 RepID=A0A1D7X6U8_NEOTH|nr:replicative DNA helicase [Moorella thermoacetica]AKX92963.1 replicative DNA helicase [Moorella thermoacetica]AKX95516.1 replicative DNA helicase [Moorella thermoacetica]AOQ22633.1 Replicative DNA helicase [Moorella thermoacetica]APC07324.1 replicative DNA helicase [Moorella thermoacetica]OIQ10319.1 replicative DNA helicase [Moorella thermoacetica]
MAAEIERVPPQSIEAEQSVLGAIMLDREALYAVLETLKVDDFYREAHRMIYRAILDLNERGEAVDLLTVTEELRRRGELEAAGGVAYLTSLTGDVPSVANAGYYARLVAEKAALRSLVQAASQITEMAFSESGSVDQILDEAERLIFEVAGGRHRSGFVPIKNVLLQTFEQLERLSTHKGEVTGVPTFHDLDRLLSGLQPSDLIICAARPGMGKTSFCLNIAQQVAVKEKLPVAIFSLEMSREQLVQRMLAAEAMVEQQRLRTGYLTEDDWARLVNAAGILGEAPIYIDDTPAISALEVRAKARRLQSETGLGLVVVDYLQLMQAHRRVDSRQQEIALISRAMKALARELNVPVMVLSQLNRGVEQRQDKRPVMADLLESGAIEADADVIIFLYRPQYYDPDTDKKGIAEVIVAKHRNGPVGTVEMAFLPEYTKFVDLAPEPAG